MGGTLSISLTETYDGTMVLRRNRSGRVFIFQVGGSQTNYGESFEFPYGPKEVTYSGSALEYREVQRPGRQALLTAVAPKNRTVALSAATGTLAISAGGTGATSLNNLVTLGTHTTGNYAATVADATNGGMTVANSGSESAAVTVALNLNDLSAAAVNVANDSIAIVDASDSNGTRKESIADLVTAMAGTNVTASSGQLSVATQAKSFAFFMS